MNQSRTGEFYGQTNKTINLEGITLTDTVYTHDRVDWHYHENAYFTFILQGNVIEGNKKEIYSCSAGDLLFHNWQEPHYNIKPEGFTRGFHIEIEKNWFDELDFSTSNLQGSMKIVNLDLKFLLHQIFRETKADDLTSQLSIQSLLLEILSEMLQEDKTQSHKNPVWVSEINQILNDQFSDHLTLNYLAKIIDIHPVHLSRDFSKYFNSGLGEYIRKLKVQKSLQLISQKKQDLTTIAFDCGFSDQSHFTRCFKEINGITPSQYRKILFG
ncbi:helix-turn-helix domain-containing protein [Chryseobacterium chendengshani]|uniref:helix-turn-helix domain-containing protein n=1 Tax=unclassified Chryseobacterium TaxID=2593645 RepID=UPI001C644B15|nr:MULTISPECIES: AraC family transcriptional regulator [unclassified Chryseobacterium]MBW7673963.1 AraC family transcriptional regulator [Chryseobacterium sp. LJ756]MBW8523095.1 AraC family transcriptional regulator [Chryseobacterium sp. LJ668]QYK16622.1 AraC family transcriptional regulator [Chryseobacterium sp. LJ668]